MRLKWPWHKMKLLKQVKKCMHSVAIMACSPGYPHRRIPRVGTPPLSHFGAQNACRSSFKSTVIVVRFWPDWNISTNFSKYHQYKFLWKFVRPFRVVSCWHAEGPSDFNRRCVGIRKRLKREHVRIGLLRYNAMKTYERMEVNSTCSLPGHWMHLSGHLHTLTTLSSFYKRLVGLWSSYGQGVRHPQSFLRGRDSKFDTHTKQQFKLYIYMFQSSHFWIWDWKTKYSEMNDSRHPPNLIWP